MHSQTTSSSDIGEWSPPPKHPLPLSLWPALLPPLLPPPLMHPLRWTWMKFLRGRVKRIKLFTGFLSPYLLPPLVFPCPPTHPGFSTISLLHYLPLLLDPFPLAPPRAAPLTFYTHSPSLPKRHAQWQRMWIIPLHKGRSRSGYDERLGGSNGRKA